MLSGFYFCLGTSWGNIRLSCLANMNYTNCMWVNVEIAHIKLSNDIKAYSINTTSNHS